MVKTAKNGIVPLATSNVKRVYAITGSKCHFLKKYHRISRSQDFLKLFCQEKNIYIYIYIYIRFSFAYQAVTKVFTKSVYMHAFNVVCAAKLAICIIAFFN